jgi:hypothetical protein
MERGPFNNRQSYTENECLPTGCYNLIVEDEFGDGLTQGRNAAGYSLTVDGTEIVSVAGNNVYWDRDVYQFGSGCNSGPPAGPTPNPTPAPTPAPTPSPVGGACKPIELELTTDDWPGEISFSLVTDRDELLWDESNFDSARATYNFDACIDPGVCATFTFLDSFGDGLFDPGRFTLRFDDSEEYSGRDFGASKVINVCN